MIKGIHAAPTDVEGDREPMAVRVEDVHKRFVQHKTDIGVLCGVNLDIAVGEMVAIVGPSGAGKSTLLHLMGGLERPTSGTVCYGAVNLFELRDDDLADFRNRHIGFVFQFHHLLPEFTALENTMMPALIQRRRKEDVQREAQRLLTDVGLGDRLHHRPRELSGGEQQRVALARALINQPDVVLADEPTGNLDRGTGQAMQKLLRRLNAERGQTFVIVTHDRDFATHMDRAVALVDGRISAV